MRCQSSSKTKVCWQLLITRCTEQAHALPFHSIACASRLCKSAVRTNLCPHRTCCNEHLRLREALEHTPKCKQSNHNAACNNIRSKSLTLFSLESFARSAPSQQLSTLHGMCTVCKCHKLDTSISHKATHPQLPSHMRDTFSI